MSEATTLGQFLRGARLGFHPVDQLAGFVQVADTNTGWLVTICPPDQIPHTKRVYRRWWDSQSDLLIDMIMDTIAPHGRNVRIKRPVELVLDSNGVLCG